MFLSDSTRVLSACGAAQWTQARRQRGPLGGHSVVGTAREHDQVAAIVGGAGQGTASHGIGIARGGLCSTRPSRSGIKTGLARGWSSRGARRRGGRGHSASQTLVGAGVAGRVAYALTQGWPLRNGPVGAGLGRVAAQLKRAITQHGTVVGVGRARSIF